MKDFGMDIIGSIGRAVGHEATKDVQMVLRDFDGNVIDDVVTRTARDLPTSYRVPDDIDMPLSRYETIARRHHGGIIDLPPIHAPARSSDGALLHGADGRILGYSKIERGKATSNARDAMRLDPAIARIPEVRHPEHDEFEEAIRTYDVLLTPAGEARYYFAGATGVLDDPARFIAHDGRASRELDDAYRNVFDDHVYDDHSVLPDSTPDEGVYTYVPLDGDVW